MRTGSGPQSAGGRDRTLAVVASACVHAIVFALLLWRLGVAPQPAATPVMNVQLTPMPEAASPRAAPPAQGKRAEARSSAHVRPDVVAPAGPARGDIAESAPGTGGEAMRKVLRGALGCRHAALLGMTPEERRRCEDQLAAARETSPPPGLNLDTRGAFVRDSEPWLARKPHNGCKIRAAGDADPAGREGPAGGLTCAWSF